MHRSNSISRRIVSGTVGRRTFLQMGILGPLGLSAAERATAVRASATSLHDDQRACIMIANVGGPSHLDTLDTKPDAPSEIRGPFRPIRTSAPEIIISELLPRHAEIARHISLVRSCYHSGAAVHHVGWQMMQTGHAFRSVNTAPHIGALISHVLGPSGDVPGFFALPAHGSHGAGRRLPGEHLAGVRDAANPRAAFSNTTASDPFVTAPRQTDVSQRLRRALDLEGESNRTCERYGTHRFGRDCLRARRLIEAGVRFVTIDSALSVHDELSWDVHGTAPYATIQQMRHTVAPAVDQAYSALIEDLDQRGLLPTTLVASLAEFGRTPRINAAGGRDHWPHCFSCYFAGGGVQGGRVIGRSDATGSQPVERPTPPADIAATIYHSFGLDPSVLFGGPLGEPATDCVPKPISELF